MINSERLCYTLTADGQTCRATAIRGQLFCFAHSPAGLRRSREIAKRQGRARRRPLTLSELAALVHKCGVARYFPELLAAAAAQSTR